MVRLLLIFLTFPGVLMGQRVFSRGGEVIYEDAKKRHISLGPGRDSVLVAGGKVLLIRGTASEWGERGSCGKPQSKNRVVLYDPATKAESVLFDRPLPNEVIGDADACIYLQADLAPSGSILYVVTPFAATSNRLVIIDLATGLGSKSIDKVLSLSVIRGGVADGNLIYSQRRYGRTIPGDNTEYPFYPVVYAKPDGTQLGIAASDPGESAQVDSFLRGIKGRIYVDGQWHPPPFP